jgi:hypothetical protein
MRLLLRPRLQILCRFVRVGVFGRNRRLHASCDDVGFYVMRLISVLLLPESVGDSRSLCCELPCQPPSLTLISYITIPEQRALIH